MKTCRGASRRHELIDSIHSVYFVHYIE